MIGASGTVAIGRLAPSPTGALHLGNARTFLLAWLSVRARQGTLRLRIEDIDGPRVKPATKDQTVEDLRWLGLDWDGAPELQSDRLPLYDEAAQRLVAAGLVYPCVCSRREIEEAASAKCGKSLALAMGRPDLAALGAEFEITIPGKPHRATVIADSPYDPTNARLRA